MWLQGPEAGRPNTPPRVWQIIEKQMNKLLGGQSLSDFCSAYARRHAADSLPQRTAAAFGLAAVSDSNSSKAAELVLAGLQSSGTSPLIACTYSQQAHCRMIPATEIGKSARHCNH